MFEKHIVALHNCFFHAHPVAAEPVRVRYVANEYCTYTCVFWRLKSLRQHRSPTDLALLTAQCFEQATCSTHLQLPQRRLHRAVPFPSTGEARTIGMAYRIDSGREGDVLPARLVRMTPWPTLSGTSPPPSPPPLTPLFCFASHSNSDPLAAYTSQVHHAPQRVPGQGRGEPLH